MTTLAAALFVGGASLRMGADKAMLILDGEPLWARQLKTLRTICPATIVVSARAKPAWLPSDVELVLDDPPSRGPLSGMVVALRKIQTTHLLALAIDLPRITADHLRVLWSLAQPGCGVVPQNGDRFEPLCAIYPAEGAGEATAALASENVSMRHFVQALLKRNLMRTKMIEAADRPLYHNVNSPDDFQDIKTHR